MTEERAPVGGFPRELSLDSSAGPAPYITRAKSEAMISAALDQAGFAPAPRCAEPKLETPPRRTTSARYAAAAVLLLAFVGVGSASAAVLWYVRAQRTPSLPVQVTEKPRAQADQAPRRTQTALPPVLVQPAPETERAVPAQRRRHAPEDLLVEGNRLRASRRWAKADEAYTHAFESAPASPAAYVARVASAAMRLEHLHDPRGALARYRAALRQIPNGSLGEEIRLGIADAHRALGERDQERAALREFLRAHPSSPLAEQARARLD